jgi:hypothetical protein
MSPTDLLKCRVAALEDELKHLSKLLAEPAKAAWPQDGGLLQRVRVPLQSLVEQHLITLEKAREASGRSPAEAWKMVMQVKRECAPLFEEALSVYQGVMLRTQTVDSGLCALADALISEIAYRADKQGWRRFTVPGDSDYFYGFVDVIRLRFPLISIWSLPVVAHEFGHYQISARGELHEAFLNRITVTFMSTGMRHEHLQEHFCDLFATWALGPAVAYFAATLLFDPREPGFAGATHPRDLARVHLIGRMLEALGLEIQHTQVEETWRQSVLAAGRTSSLSNKELDELSDLFQTIRGLLEQEAPGLKYRTWGEALRIAGGLERHEPAKDVIRDNSSLADVLNAAWHRRIWTEDIRQIEDLGERTVEYCNQVALRARE